MCDTAVLHGALRTGTGLQTESYTASTPCARRSNPAQPSGGAEPCRYASNEWCMHPRRCRRPVGRPSAARPASCTRTLRRRNLSPVAACHLCLLTADMPCSTKALHAPNVAASAASETLARVSRMQRAMASAEIAADFRSSASSAAVLTHLDEQSQAGIEARPHGGLADRI